MATAAAKLEELDGKPALRFERLLSHPPERVWNALIDPERQLGWSPTPARIELEVGGRVEYLDSGFAGSDSGEVTAVDPPHLLAYTWIGSDNHLRWELRPHDAGCLLTLTQTFADRTTAPDFGAGWHMCLDALPAALEGSTERPRADRTDEAPWPELKAEYRRRFATDELGPRIRRATAQDAPTVARLLHDFNAEFEDETPGVEKLVEYTRPLIASGEITVLIAGEADGLSLLRLRPSPWTGQAEAYLQELYVVPALRGEGIGRALLEATMKVAREAGASGIDLNTGETDTAARALYESAGFTNLEGPGGPQMLFYEREL